MEVFKLPDEEKVRESKEKFTDILGGLFDTYPSNIGAADEYYRLWKKRKGPLLSLLQGDLTAEADITNTEEEDGEEQRGTLYEIFTNIFKDTAFYILLLSDGHRRDYGFTMHDERACPYRMSADENGCPRITNILENKVIELSKDNSTFCLCPALVSMVVRGVILTTPIDNTKQNKTISGMKMSKYLKTVLFPSSTPTSIIDTFDSMWSMFIQRILPEDGKIVLSADPVDFLTMSEANRWQSCHRLHGEYKAGPFGYILDPCTMIAFRPGTETKEHYGGIVLPDKTWRQVVHVDVEHKSAVFGRHYPNNKDDYEATTRRIVGYLLSNDDSPKWKLVRNSGTTEISSGRMIYGESNGRRVIYLKDGGSLPTIHYGADEILCPICGYKHTDPEEILCGNCMGQYGEGEYVICCNCGEEILADDSITSYSGDNYCEECYHEMYVHCDECGQEVYRDDSFYVNGRYLCMDCFGDSYVVCEHCGEPILLEDAIEDEDNEGEYYCGNCIEDNLYQCTNCGSWYRQDSSINPMIVDNNGETYCEDCYNEMYPPEEENVEEVS
jgi:ribosomal protein S26